MEELVRKLTFLAIILLICLVYAEDTIPPYVELLWPDSGAYVSCQNVTVEMIILDRDFWVDRGSILLSINTPGGFHAIDEFTFSWVDSFFYFPIDEELSDGDSLWCLMSPIADYDSNYTDGFSWMFHIDLSGPELSDLSPPPGSEVSDPHTTISAVVSDQAGLTADSCFITIEGDSFDLFEGYAAWMADTFVFYSGLAGLFFAGGDTIDVCVYAGDSAEGCGINHSDTCWWFTLPSGGPTAELDWPDEGAWISCIDTVARFRIEDEEGVEEDSIRIEIGAESWTTADAELSWSPPYLYFDLSGLPEGPVNGTLYASDIIGNNMDPPLDFDFGLDFTPPYLLNEIPAHNSAILDLDPEIFFDIQDALSGVMHSPTLAGVSVDGSPMSWFSLSEYELSLAGDTYRLDSIAVPPLHGGDTVTIRTIAFDTVTVCETNRLDTTWFFYVPFTPPEGELILPDSGIVSACAGQEIWFYLADDEGVKESSIMVRVSGFFYDLDDPELTYENDTLRFVPPSPWSHGSYVWGSLYYVEDILGNAIDDRVRFGFYVDLEGPEIVSVSPPEFSLSADTLREARIRIDDVPAGLDPASVQITVDGFPYIVDGSNLRWEDPYLVFDPVSAGAWDEVDSVEICLTDAYDDPDTCPPNSASPFCWTFYIDARDPVANPPEGAIVACTEQEIQLYLWAPGGIIDSTILIEINGTPYTTADPRLYLSAEDTLVFDPDAPWPDGDSVRCLLVHAEGELGSSIDSVYWGFLMDYSNPVLIAANPMPGAEVSEVDPSMEFVLADEISGLLSGAFELTFNGGSYGWSHPALSIVEDTFSFDPAVAGLHIAGGDTAEICIHAEDHAYPEYCGPNIMDTCYIFSIEAGGPTAEMLTPQEFVPYGCDSNIIIVVDDHNGYLWETLEIFINGDPLYHDDPRMAIYGDTIEIHYDHSSGETLHVAFNSLMDSLENQCEIIEWDIVFDHEPPVVEWIFPAPGTTLTFTDLTALTAVYDEVTSAGVTVLEGHTYSSVSDTLFFDFAGLEEYDTVEITLEVTDSAECPNVDTLAMVFYIDAAPPMADLILPEDSSWTLCDSQQVRILLTDPSGIDPAGLQADIGGDLYSLSAPNLRLSGDTLIFDPDSAFTPGFVEVGIVFAQDRWGNVLSGFESGFYQENPPAIAGVDPGPGASSSSVSPAIYVDYEFGDSSWIEIDGTTYTDDDPGFAYLPGDTVAFDTELAGLEWTAGDTIDLCAYILENADYCGPAIAESCWSFYIQYSPPEWSFIVPECSSWTACENQEFVMLITDDDGVDEATITVSVNGDTFDTSYLELNYNPAYNELHFSPTAPFVSDTIVFCLLSVADILGAPAGSLPACCEMYLDIEPPDAAFDPPPGEYLPVPGDPLEIRITDEGAGPNVDSVSANGVWIYPSSDELDWSDPLAIFDFYQLLDEPPPDSVEICIAASDLIDSSLCGPNDTIYCVNYPLNIEGPVIDMILPGNGVVTSCSTGALEFSAKDIHSIDTTTTRLVLNGVEIIPPDSRLTFPNDSTIVYTPDSAWHHGATVCGTLTVEDTLGAISLPYGFCVTIDIEPPEIIEYEPFANIIDTFETITIFVEDVPAGIDYDSPIITVDNDTVYHEWHGDTIVVYRDSLEFCEFDTLQVSTIGLSDMAAVCGQNILVDEGWSFSILDDDTLGPSFSGFSPGSANSGIPFAVTVEVEDTSGVYQAYALWSEGEELAPDADSVGMSEFTSGVWASDSIGPVYGDWVTVAVCAWDNDFDCDNPQDRSLACDTVLVPLFPLELQQQSILHDSWNPEEWGGALCVGEKFSSNVLFVNPDSITLYADSMSLAIGQAIQILEWADTVIQEGESLFVPLELFGETDGDFADTLKIYDHRFIYPIGVDTLYAGVMFCNFEAGPNPFSPNGDGIYDEFKIELPQTGDIEIRFYRLEGQYIRTLRGTGRQYAWNGEDNAGQPQPPGIYLWVIRIDGDLYKHGSVTIAR